MNRVVHFEIPADNLERAKKFDKAFVNGGLMKRDPSAASPVIVMEVEDAPGFPYRHADMCRTAHPPDRESRSHAGNFVTRSPRRSATILPRVSLMRLRRDSPDRIRAMRYDITAEAAAHAQEETARPMQRRATVVTQ